MNTDKKLVIALGIAGLLGFGLYKQRQTKSIEMQAHSLEAAAAELPKIELTDEQIASIDTIELYKPAQQAEGETEAKPAETSVLKKKGEEEWDIVQPLQAKGNATNVKSLLDNLKKLEVREQIDPSAASYDQWKVSDDKALRAVFKKGDEVVFEAFFGESGSRGQMTRIAGKEGVYTVKGYSKFLYERDTKGWRDKTIFKFDDKEAVKVTIENEHGKYQFDKDGEDWKSGYAKAGALKPIKDFKSSKVGDMVRAFKGLNATDFGDGKTVEDTGLSEPTATLVIELKNGAKYELLVGGEGETNNRWCKTASDAQIYGISSWASGWALAEVSKFQEEKKDDKKGDDKKGDDKKGDDKKGDDKKGDDMAAPATSESE